ncbi:MAG: hypothetical protein K0Q99_1542 [Clostridia bacterium]|nr:hypothetical protein [Clostridia bacterium]
MADNNQNVPNVMPDAMLEPISDMDLIVAKLKHDGEMNNRAERNTAFENSNKEV